MAYRQYLGWLDGEPVATSAVIFGAGVAGIYELGTLPTVRRQGIGTALTLAPLPEARRVGYHIAIAHASDMAANAKSLFVGPSAALSRRYTEIRRRPIEGGHMTDGEELTKPGEKTDEGWNPWSATSAALTGAIRQIDVALTGVEPNLY